MRSKLVKALMCCALAAGASSCGSNTEVRLELPPVADMKPATEPLYPLAALEPGDAGRAAEDLWWNDVLAWGRTEHGKVQRICVWADTLGKKHDQALPKGWCE